MPRKVKKFDLDSLAIQRDYIAIKGQDYEFTMPGEISAKDLAKIQADAQRIQEAHDDGEEEQTIMDIMKFSIKHALYTTIENEVLDDLTFYELDFILTSFITVSEAEAERITTGLQKQMGRKQARRNKEPEQDLKT